ncbi:MAG: hypothetical protein PWP65_1698 [Clostridia bacterium]|nr:hypothetical protein [Clostridia bacterium]
MPLKCMPFFDPGILKLGEVGMAACERRSEVSRAISCAGGGAVIRGRVRLDRCTKNLLYRLKPQDIAVIDHEDLDVLAAQGLARLRPRAVINASPCFSGRYPHTGALPLLEAGVPVLDAVGPEIFNALQEGQVVELRGGAVYLDGRALARGRWLKLEDVQKACTHTSARFQQELEEFARNTLKFAQQELEVFLGKLTLPDLKLPLQGCQVLVVVRGQDYQADLKALRPYIEEAKPVLIGVDGGADAILELGYRPHLIVGDMDSVSDRALRCGAELVVHAYPDGRAPGLARLERLGLKAVLCPAPGTSEDLALLLAYEKGAELIVAVGTHTNVIDFLAKGRKGMASTFLVRLKVGSILIDAKGVSRLYRRRYRGRYLAAVVVAALWPLAALILASPLGRQITRLLWLRLQVALGL